MRVHRFAVATALATFCLLVAGGLVSTTESGLACPDWPLCEGKLIPKMVDGKQFEHTHRLVASAVATMTFVLCAMIFKRRQADRLLKRLGVAAAVLVVLQALLGALTVKLALPAWVSSLHLATAMAFFCTAVTLAFLTRQRMRGDAAHEKRTRLRIRFSTVPRQDLAAGRAMGRSSAHDSPRWRFVDGCGGHRTRHRHPATPSWLTRSSCAGDDCGRSRARASRTGHRHHFDIARSDYNDATFFGRCSAARQPGRGLLDRLPAGAANPLGCRNAAPNCCFL